jgi:hypothetical protein
LKKRKIAHHCWDNPDRSITYANRHIRLVNTLYM